MRSNIYMGRALLAHFCVSTIGMLETAGGVGNANAERPTGERAQSVQRSDDAGTVSVL